MRKRLILNDIRKNRLFTAATVAFMTVSAMLFALTVLLSVSLLSSIQTLMEQAETPDFLQMHAGTVKEEEISAFAEAHPEVEDWQVMPFLNLENSKISLGEHSLADSTQDNGLSVQGQSFDYLVDLTNELPKVWPGEVFAPICYRAQYELAPGDVMQIGNRKFTIAGFIRDSQMNSMMASSKRFLVNEADYESMQKEGTEEYLIEFRLHEGTDTGVFENAYKEAGLPDNGPAVTKPLIRMMNALSDGMMILVILLVSVVADPNGKGTKGNGNAPGDRHGKGSDPWTLVCKVCGVFRGGSIDWSSSDRSGTKAADRTDAGIVWRRGDRWLDHIRSGTRGAAGRGDPASCDTAYFKKNGKTAGAFLSV